MNPMDHTHHHEAIDGIGDDSEGLRGTRPVLAATMMRNVSITYAPEYEADVRRALAVFKNEIVREEDGPDGTRVIIVSAPVFAL